MRAQVRNGGWDAPDSGRQEDAGLASGLQRLMNPVPLSDLIRLYPRTRRSLDSPPSEILSAFLSPHALDASLSRRKERIPGGVVLGEHRKSFFAVRQSLVKSLVFRQYAREHVQVCRQRFVARK